MINKVKRQLKKDDGLLSAGLIFMIAGVLGSAFNYLYHVFMGRMLGPVEYGVLGSLFAIIYIVTFSTSTFSLVLSKFSAELHSKNEDGCLKYLIKKSITSVLFFGGIFLLVYIILSPLIGIFMKIENYTAIILVGIIGYLSVISAMVIGSLNGLQKFVKQNLVGTLRVILKFGFAILLVYIGFGVVGALSAILISSIFTSLFGIFYLNKFIRKIEIKKIKFTKIFRYSIFVLISSTFGALIITIDHIFVKHFFSSSDAGMYSAAGMIAKIIWFGSGFFAGALFPKIVSLVAKKKNTIQLFRKVIFYTIILASIGCLVLFIVPDFIVLTLYGIEYISISKLIPLFGLALALYSIIILFIQYNMAKSNFNFLWFLIIGVIIEILGINFFHNTLIEIIKVVFIVNVFILTSFIIFNRRELGVDFEGKTHIDNSTHL